MTSSREIEPGGRRRARSSASVAGIRDVAALAGVSIGTVSNVLNRPQLVAPATLQRVERAMTELSFVPDGSARQLRAGASRVLGVMVLDIGNPFWGEVVRGVEAVASQAGYAIMVCSSDETPDKEVRNLQALLEHRVEGLLIAPVLADDSHLESFLRRGIAVVLLDRRSSSPQIASVSVDDVHGGRIAAEHALDRGHARIALVNGDGSIPWCADRRAGVHAAVAARGLDPEQTVCDMRVSTLTAREGESVVPQLLDIEPAPTAVICANDLLALGVLRGLTQRGLRVPDDIALVGYDDDDFAAVLQPPLTTVRQEPYRVGRTAAEMLLTPPPEPSRRVVFEPELVVRDST